MLVLVGHMPEALKVGLYCQTAIPYKPQNRIYTYRGWAVPQPLKNQNKIWPQDYKIMTGTAGGTNKLDSY